MDISNKLNDIKTIKKILIIIVVTLIFYLLKILSFIFIPLVFASLIAMLFMPLMRWLFKHKVPKILSILIVIIIIAGGLKITGKLVQLSSKEIMSSRIEFWDKASPKLNKIIIPVGNFFGFESNSKTLNDFTHSKEVTQTIYKNFGTTFSFVKRTISMTVMIVFFLILLLAGSLNIQRVMESTVFKKKYASVKTFIVIEKSVAKFLKVKLILSLLTGIGFGILCFLFGVSFPIFWGLIAFAINFIQLLGSIVATTSLSLFAFVEMDSSSTLLFFILSIIAVQVLFGAILEPIFMGKSFSINIITVLVMLMLWGYIWGIPGMILSIPITVFVKTILEQFPSTKIVSNLMS